MMLRYLYSLLLLVCLISSANAQDSKLIQLGNVSKVTLGAKEILLQTEQGSISIIPYDSDIVRVHIAQAGKKNNLSYGVIGQPKGSFTDWNQSKNEITASTGDLKLRISKSPYQLKVWNKAGKLIVEDDTLGTTWQGTEVMAYKKMHPTERFIGLGEKTGHLDRKGSFYENWNTDDFGYEAEADPLYATIPFFVGLRDSATYGIFLDNTYRSYFSFAASTDNTFYHFGAADGALDYYIFGASDVSKIIEDYTWLTGRMNLPPKWSLGYQQCRYSYYPDTEVLAIAKTFREKKIPADVIYLDIHYMDAYKIFTFHPERFSKPKSLMDELKGMGFKVVTIVDPGIKVEKGYHAFDELAANGYYAKYPNGKPYIGSVWPGRCYFPDFTNPEGRAWWGKSFKTLTDAGVRGFWNDMNEPAAWGQYIPGSLNFNFEGQGASYKKIHNVYGMQMSRATLDGTKKLMGERPFILTRASYSGGQRYSAIWTGDNVATDEHMLLGVRMVSSLGLSGFPFAGCDIAGFAGEPSDALYLRWLNIGVYTPLFRGHTAYDGRDHEPWSFGESNEEIAKNLIRQRYAMMPYLYSAMYTATQNGLPIVRTLAIQQPFDAMVYDLAYENEFMFGDNILVAPVSSKSNAVKVYFPAGDWYHMQTGEMFAGGQVKLVEAPIGQLPVFVKGGTVTPMVTPGDYVEVQRDTLQLHIYKGKSGSKYVFYEDDGISYKYEDNNIALRTIEFNGMNDLKVAAQTGSFNSSYKYAELVFHGFGSVKNVSSNGNKISGKNVIAWGKGEMDVKWEE